MQLDKIYKKRFQDVGMRRELWRVLVRDYFQQFISKKDVVLDLPCGYAEFINEVDCRKRIAVDVNGDSKKYVEKDVEFIQADSSELPLKAKSIDKVFISNFFEHLTKEEVTKTVQELKRVLKKGGKVLVLQPNIRFAAKDYWMFFDHIHPVDDRALSEVFEINGLMLKKRVLRFLPYTTQGRIPAHPLLVRAYLKFPPAWRLLGKQTFMIFEA